MSDTKFKLFDRIKRALDFRVGKKYFTSKMNTKSLIEDVMIYSEKIGRSPDNYECYILRSECLKQMKEFELASRDIMKVMELNPKFPSAYGHAIKCHLLLGEIEEAETVLERFKRFAPNYKLSQSFASQIEQIKTLHKNIDDRFSEHFFGLCLLIIDDALLLSPACENLKVIKLMCLVNSKRFVEAEKVDCQLNFMGILIAYNEGNLDESSKLLGEMLPLMPKNVKSFDVIINNIKKFDDGLQSGKLIGYAKYYEREILIFCSISSCKAHCEKRFLISNQRLRVALENRSLEQRNHKTSLDETCETFVRFEAWLRFCNSLRHGVATN